MTSVWQDASTRSQVEVRTTKRATLGSTAVTNDGQFHPTAIVEQGASVAAESTLTAQGKSTHNRQRCNDGNKQCEDHSS